MKDNKTWFPSCNLNYVSFLIEVWLGSVINRISFCLFPWPSWMLKNSTSQYEMKLWRDNSLILDETSIHGLADCLEYSVWTIKKTCADEERTNCCNVFLSYFFLSWQIALKGCKGGVLFTFRSAGIRSWLVSILVMKN